ncbi:DUF397 domain-containing protein [Actinomadura welshii]
MMSTRPVWRKSSRSTQGTSGECVEVARLGGVIGLRDSQRPGHGYITLTPAAFNAFVQEIKGARS